MNSLKTGWNALSSTTRMFLMFVIAYMIAASFKK